MLSICIYLQIHQPYRVRKYKSHYIGKNSLYFNGKYADDINNKEIFNRVCRKSYLPTSKILQNLLKKYPDFKLSLSFSGTVLEQMEKFSPETLRSFQKLHKTGRVEMLAETYYHSLSFFYSLEEFERQVDMHRKKIKKLFGAEPKIFRNTELSYTNELAKWAENKGYKGIMTEGWKPYLKNKSPNFLYKPEGTEKIKILLKNYKLSDDIAFRFSEKRWDDWPLTPKKFADWLSKERGETVNLFMDFETFGEHQWKETGILKFLKELPAEISKKSIIFRTAEETVDKLKTHGKLNVPQILTWADTERDLSAWVGNKKQQKAIKAVYQMEKDVLETSDRKIIEDWRKLQTSDHFYYMCTKWFADGDIHAYFSPYPSPEKAYSYFSNAIYDLKLRIESYKKTKPSKRNYAKIPTNSQYARK